MNDSAVNRAAGEQTIEQSWDVVAERLGWNVFKDSSIEPEKAVVRAALLAVLEEAVHSANCVLRMIGEDPIMDGHDLRRRIEALG